MKSKCPICNENAIESLLNNSVPILQNKVYKSESEAKKSGLGIVNLTHCQNCNFTFNGDFDDSIIVYDETYDNSVPSKLFIEYYKTICHYLYKKYDLENGVVYDIGCGKGTFLNMLCELYPSIKGIGIDPSYEGDLNPKSNLTFFKEFFDAKHVTSKPNLILSRHVFEHIEFPRKFLDAIREPIKEFDNVPVFIEVPDFEWIVENQTFWDICYEHCNYFSEKSIQEMFTNSWSILTRITKSFGEQYLWVEGLFNPRGLGILDQKFLEVDKSKIMNFITSIQSSQERILQFIKEYKNEKYKIIVWGMATKGVIFTNNIDSNKLYIDYCVDINKEKQHKYSPVTAHYINSPEVLNSLSVYKCLVIVMNTNYIKEIKNEVSQHDISAEFIDAHGNLL